MITFNGQYRNLDQSVSIYRIVIDDEAYCGERIITGSAKSVQDMVTMSHEHNLVYAQLRTAPTAANLHVIIVSYI
jgi:hypothetical protein